MLKSIIFVALGSGIGGVLRFGISHMFAHTPPTNFPWGTFTCNLAGCLLLGFFYALAEKYQWLNADVRLMLTVGLCGGGLHLNHAELQDGFRGRFFCQSLLLQ